MQYIVHGYVKNNKRVLNVHPGSWFGLPDFGVTEAIGGLLGSGRNAQGGSNIIPNNISSGQAASIGPTRSVLGSSTQQGPGGAYPIAGGNQSPSYSTGSNSGGSQSRADAWRAGGGQGDVPAGWNGFVDNAKAGYNSTIDAIQKKLDLVRNQAQDQITNATGSRDYLVNFINQRYPELQNRVNQQRDTANQGFDTQQTTLQNLYDQANAKARRASEDAALQNRMSARAGNRLGSSFYDQTVQGNQENLGRTLGASDLERIGKLAALGTQRNTSNQNFDNTINDLNTQKDQATYQAMDEYNKALQQADYLKQAGVNDFGTSESQATQNLQSRLDSISQWAQQMAQQQQAFDAQYGKGGGFDTTLGNYAANNQSFLAGNAATPAGNAANTYTPNVIQAPQNNIAPNLLGFGNQKPLTLQDILNGVRPGGLTAAA